jgi:histidine phosphotransferase ChpT
MCHDLASPIGAVGNGVELVELAGKTLGQEGELVKASVNAAAAKLKLFRIAYGQFHSEEILHAAEISAVQTAWNITGRIQVDFALHEIPKTDMKIYLSILQSIQVAMPQGAKVVVKITEGRKIVHAVGAKVTYDETLWSALTNKDIAPNIQPNNVQFAILQALDVPLHLNHSDTEMTVSF